MKREYIIAVAVLSLLPSVVTAEWGYGLSRECNSMYGPSSHQTGIDCTAQSQKMAAPAEKTEAKTDSAPVQQAKATPAAAPAAAAPAAAASAAASKPIPDTVWRLEGVNFESRSDQLSLESQTALNEVGETLRTNPRVVVEIQGHTDNNGNEAWNADLSARRALTVKKYLEIRGVEAKRMTAKGYGASKPVADNATVEGREENRRIEFKVLSQ